MRTYIEAYRDDGSQILGNLDGQAALRARDYRRTNHYKALRYSHTRPKWLRVKYWLVVDEDGHLLERIENR